MSEQSLGEFVRKRRKELGLSQEKLAELVKMNTAYIGRLEVGKQVGSPTSLIAVAKALRVRPGKLLDVLGDIPEVTEENYIELPADFSRAERQKVLHYIRHLERLEDKERHKALNMGVTLPPAQPGKQLELYMVFVTEETSYPEEIIHHISDVLSYDSNRMPGFTELRVRGYIQNEFWPDFAEAKPDQFKVAVIKVNIFNGLARIPLLPQTPGTVPRFTAYIYYKIDRSTSLDTREVFDDLIRNFIVTNPKVFGLET